MPNHIIPPTSVNVGAVQDAAVAEVLKKLEGSVRTAIKHAVTRTVGRMPGPTSNDNAPKAGGKCAAVWSQLDELAKRYPGQVPKLTEVMNASRKAGWNDNNTRVEYYRWRRNRGIIGRIE